jgi:hypothetical protein
LAARSATGSHPEAPGENMVMADSVLKKLVRNFPENGPKLLLENPANVRDLLLLLHEKHVDAIDFKSSSRCS